MFYVKDWRSDPALSRVSKTARATWMDMLCLMFDCEERGFLITGSSAWSDHEIAAACRGDVESNLSDIAELLAKGVAFRDSRGAIFSRRLVRDEEQRQGNAVRQKQFRKSAQDNYLGTVTGMSRDCHAESNGHVTALSGNANAYANGSTTTPSSTQEVRTNACARTKRASTVFVKPTIEEIRQFCADRKNTVDAETFFAHYEKTGWRAGRNAIKSWKYAVIYWERTNNNFGEVNGQSRGHTEAIARTAPRQSVQHARLPANVLAVAGELLRESIEGNGRSRMANSNNSASAGQAPRPSALPYPFMEGEIKKLS